MLVEATCHRCKKTFTRDHDEGWKILCPACWRMSAKYHEWRIRQGLPVIEVSLADRLRHLGMHPR